MRKFLNVKQVADELEIVEETVRRLIREEKITAFKLDDNKWYARMDHIEELRQEYDNRPGHKANFKWEEFLDGR